MKFLISSFAFLFLVFFAGQAQALTSGATATGSISAGGTSPQSFTGTAGQGVMLSAYSASYSVIMTINKPDGTLWASVSGGRFTGTLPATGTYNIVLSASSPSAFGSYSIDYVRGSSSVSDGALTSGQTYSGSLAIGGLESFQFSGTSGQGVMLSTAAPAYTMYVDIYRPDGSYWSGSSSGRFNNTLPATGTYTVIAYGANLTNTGSYKLDYVIGGGSVSDGPLNSGQTYNGNLAIGGIESFQITGNTGQEVVLYTAAPAYTMYVEVYKPDGTYLGYSSSGRYSGTLPTTGTYTVFAYGSGVTNTGPYNLYYVRGAGSVSDGFLTTGSARGDTLAVNGIRSYKFSAVSGNSLAVASTAPSFTRLLTLYKPDGSYYAYGYDSISTSIPTSGDYTLTVVATSTSATGNYTVTQTTPPGTVAASTATKVATAPSSACEEGGIANSTSTSPVTLVANPINFDVGFKAQTATDYDAGGLTFSRIYRSDSTWTSNTMGTYWRHNYARSLTVTATAASITDGTGATTTYTLTGGNWIPDDPSTTATFKTVSTTYVYTLPDNTVEKYDSNKRLTRIEYLGGGALNLAYNGSGQLTTITNENGRQLSLTYTSGRVATLVTPDGTYTYGYGANSNLTTVTKPDTKVITYHYENTTLVNALTGITDEKSIRYATFTYNNTSGKAIRSEHAGAVDDYDVAYNVSGTSTTTNPLNKNTDYIFTNIQGVRKIIQVDGVASTNCVASNRYYNYNEKGWLLGKTDWENNVTNYLYDSRGNITQIIAGAGTTAQQITNITYDPTFNLPDIVTEAGKTTDYAYDAFGRTTSVTITDTATAETRITSYTYWANGTDPSGNTILGRLKQINGPRTDVTDTTDFAYDANYNLTTITNALSQVTSITTRDAAGRPTNIRDANNIDTRLTYDTNGWLKTSTSAYGTALAAVTTYDYEFNGLLKKVTLPNSVFLEYSYDNAQRLTGVKDNQNNTITYTLNNAGDITKEDIKDSSAVLKYTHSQVFDELSRVIQSVGAATPAQTAVSTYDKNGNIKSYTDPKTYPTTYAYDALWRLTSSTDALNGTVNPGYNALDDMTSAKDARNNTTTFTYNAFGDITSETSPDRGLTSYVLDKAGNVTQKTDARSVVTNYTYDAINRPLTVAYPAQSALNVTLTYDVATNCGTAYKGRLCTVADAGGSYAYQYDVLGRVTQDKATRGATNLTTNYTYDLAGNLATVQLPSTRTITYTRNTNGRLTGASAPIAGTATTLASSGTYLPFGPMTGLTYGNSKVLTAAFDTDYNPTSRAVATLFSNTYTTDKNSNITQAGTPTYGYDQLNRVNAENPGTAASYTYDLTDNRLTKTQGSTTTTTVPSTSNKISAVGAASYTYDLAGNITGDGTNTYTWDNEGQLATAKVGATTVGTYTYDYLGRRTKKVAGATTTLYIYGPDGLLYGEYTTAGVMNKEYVYLDAAPLAQISAGSPETIAYLHVDHLGTPRYGTNAAGTSVWAWTADAFGISTPTGSATVNLRMPGQYFDSESGNFYNWNRYYKPSIGRYLSPDPIGLDGGDLNLFSYVGQSPAVGIDPYGLYNQYDFQMDLADAQINAIQGLAGLTDVLTLGQSRAYRERTGQTYADECSLAYRIGNWSGLGVEVVGGGGAGKIGLRSIKELLSAKNSLLNLSPKIKQQMQGRGWSDKDLLEALSNRPGIPAMGKKGPATRYINPRTGQSIVVDNTTGEIFHVGGPGFKY